MYQLINDVLPKSSSIDTNLPHYGDVTNAYVVEVFHPTKGWIDAPNDNEFSSNLNYAKLVRASHVSIGFMDQWSVFHIADFSLNELGVK